MAVAFNEGRMKLRILKQGNERIIFFFFFFFCKQIKAVLSYMVRSITLAKCKRRKILSASSSGRISSLIVRNDNVSFLSDIRFLDRIVVM